MELVEEVLGRQTVRVYQEHRLCRMELVVSGLFMSMVAPDKPSGAHGTITSIRGRTQRGKGINSLGGAKCFTGFMRFWRTRDAAQPSERDSIDNPSYLKERQVSKGVDRVQHAAVIMSGRVSLSTLKDGDVQRKLFVSAL